jgi:diguanylate cyclase (GGDEF)-like protein/PAS domain S-box-containing protein
MQRLPGGRDASSVDPVIALGLDELPASSVMIFDRDLVFRLVRGAAVREQGLEPAELEGRHAAEALGADRWAFYEPLYRRALDGEASSFEVPGRSGSGMFRVDVAPVRDDDGRVIGGSSVAVDITEQRRLTDALAASEERFHQTMRHASIGIALVGEDGRFLDVNEAFAGLLRYSIDDLVGRSILEVTDPADAGVTESVFREIVSGQRASMEVRKRYLRADGSLVWADIAVSRVAAEDGTFLHNVVVVDDITREMEQAEALRRSSERFRLLAENASDIVYETTRDGRILWVSSAVRTVLGYEPDELVGRRLFELLDPAMAEVGEAERERFFEAGSESVRADVRLVARDGQPRDMELTARRIVGHDGRIGAVIGLRDVSEQLAAQHQLALSEERFRLLAENASDVVYMATRDGTMLWVSPSALPVLGRDPESMVGHRAEEFVHPDDAEKLTTYRRDFYAGTLDGDWILRWPTPAGVREMSLVVHAVDLPDGPGAVIGLHDITEAQRARRELARSEERFRLAMAAAPIGMAISDSSGAFREVNEALQELLGVGEDELLGRSVSDFLPPEEAHLAQDATEALHQQGDDTMRHEHRLVSRARSVWVEHAASIMRGEDGQALFYVHQFVDRTEAYELRRDLEFRASHDPLTGVINRGELMRELERGLRRARGTASWLGVLFIDVDNLKTLNDEHGHGVGDAAIRAVADRLASAVRSQDLVARIGGDEFVVLLERLHTRDELAAVAAKLHSAVTGPLEADGRSLDLSVSVGAVLAGHDESPDDVLARADRGLLRAKAAGRRQVDVD